jgi:hypothetical protein
MSCRIDCWCGMRNLTPGRLHYIANDPENGPAHPAEVGVDCKNCQTSGPQSGLDSNGICEPCRTQDFSEQEILAYEHLATTPEQDEQRIANTCNICETVVPSSVLIREETSIEGGGSFIFVICRWCFIDHGTPNNPDAKEWTVHLPYVCVRDAIVNATYPQICAPDEESAIRIAAIDNAKETGGTDNGDGYVHRWKQWKERPMEFDMEDLVPRVYLRRQKGQEVKNDER